MKSANNVYIFCILHEIRMEKVHLILISLDWRAGKVALANKLQPTGVA
jgi:hypothetical protein